MARSRNIKPAFFKNEALAELPFEHRLLFIGLWTLADREGKLEDRPRRIKMELFPADDVKVDLALSELAAHGFIERYQTSGVKVLRVNNFLKHQNPHPREKESSLPEPDELSHRQGRTKVMPSKDQGGDKPQTSRADILNPDILNPDILNPADHTRASTAATPKRAISTKASQSEKTAIQRKALPQDFELTPASQKYALERDLDTENELQTFCNYHIAKGSLMLDWQAAWRAWCNNAVRFGKTSLAHKRAQRGAAYVFKQSAIEQKNKETLERLLQQGAPDEA